MLLKIETLPTVFPLYILSENKIRSMFKKIIEPLTILVIFGVGLYYRLVGISTNHSFWADEAYVASIAKKMFLNQLDIFSGMSLVAYQRLSLITMYTSFKFFGASEWAARIPFVILSSLGIISAYLLAKKLSNKWGGLMAAIMIGFSQVSLAQSTQSKPYATILSFILLSQYLTLMLFDTKSNRKGVWLNILTILINIITTLFNYIGIIVWIPYIVFIVVSYHKLLRDRRLLVGALFLFSILAILLRVPYIFLEPVAPKYNWFSYFNELFLRQYLVFTIPAVIAILGIKNRYFKLSVIIQFTLLFVAWNYFKESHNIRYIYPMLGYIFVLFSVFFANIGEKKTSNPWIVPALVLALTFTGGYKIVRKPAPYYSPNFDFYSDVQNADYKTFFAEAKRLYPKFEKMPIFVGPFDTLNWYTNINPTSLFSINTTSPIFVPATSTWQYGNLSDFKKEKSKYPTGLVVVNDWQSFMPNDIKDYVKKNMKLELRIESMLVSPQEKWPLELYSWGDEKSR